MVGIILVIFTRIIYIYYARSCFSYHFLAVDDCWTLVCIFG